MTLLPQDDQRCRQRIADNWKAVSQQVADAAIQAGRQGESVQIIGVTKYVDAPTTSMLVDAGCHQLGESRPQVLWRKAETIDPPDSVRWHMIGHVQTNKLRRLLRHRVTIHSVDSDRLLKKIAEETAGQDLKTRVFLEVNASGESNKTGMDDQSLRETIAAFVECDSQTVDVCGLMAMAGRNARGSETRQQFAAVRHLMDRLNDEFPLRMTELSMGMSGDFADAIAEGATMVRIGSALFEGIET